jgi:hypothetical protein
LAEDHWTLSAGSAAASMRIAVTAATSPGRRMTARARRYQRSVSGSRDGAVRASLRPHTASSAGDTISAASAATTATQAPAMPIDFRNPCGNRIRVASAHATVAAEKITVWPARVMVVAIASFTVAPAASSWRKRVTRNRV